ncbi:hypothetical protein E4U15_000400 [Claviceps sp. LM218 group G6]|nr:hypothetical protein E4U15_000400 [Claviceps sp. LM218 group G6]
METNSVVQRTSHHHCRHPCHVAQYINTVSTSTTYASSLWTKTTSTVPLSRSWTSHKDWEPYTPDEIKELEDDEGLGVIDDGTTPAPFHDGLTDDWEEDVDWMYMSVVYYLDRYFNLVKDDWDQEYVRPPYIDGWEDESTFKFHWTLEKEVTGEKCDEIYGRLETVGDEISCSAEEARALP